MSERRKKKKKSDRCLFLKNQHQKMISNSLTEYAPHSAARRRRRIQQKSYCCSFFFFFSFVALLSKQDLRKIFFSLFKKSLKKEEKQIAICNLRGNLELILKY